MYAFLLGRIKELSIAELKSLLPEKSIKYTGEEILLADIKIEKPQKFLDNLGGVIKIIQILKKPIKDDLLSKAKASKKKTLFAVSVHNLSFDNEIRVKTKLITLKKFIKSNEQRCAFINKKIMENASFVAIKKKGLIETETDYSYIKVPGNALTPDAPSAEPQFLEGVTVAIQDFENYSYRDYERPAKDINSGMLPPKMAQIMLNLTSAPGKTLDSGTSVSSILDPFCGSGTILQEALLMDKNAFGSDKSEKAVDDSKKNIKWLKKEFKIKKSLVCEIQKENAKELTLPKQKSLAIVTETYLGPALKNMPQKSEIASIHKDVKVLYLAFFKHLHEIGQNGLQIVMAFPAHIYKKEIVFIPKLQEEIEKLGFKTISLTPGRPSLVYKRKDQFVAREVFKFVLEKSA